MDSIKITPFQNTKKLPNIKMSPAKFNSTPFTMKKKYFFNH